MNDDRMAEAPIPEKISGDEALRRKMEAAVSPDAMPIDENVFLNSKSLDGVEIPQKVGFDGNVFQSSNSLNGIELPDLEGVKEKVESEAEKSGPKM